MKKKNKNNYLKILGSVSPYSTKKENGPGYLLALSNKKLLLDCGPGVSKSLKFPDDLENLYIFISHFHKDHYIDIYSIAYATYVYHNLGILNKRIKVYIPKMNKNQYGYDDYILLTKLKEQYFEIIEYDENSIVSIDEDIRITFCENYHSILTFSTKIEYLNTKIIYTSDSGYKSKDKIAIFARNANILLIESTFLSKDNKNSEFHLSTIEAANIAKNANVNKMILTHFWPEYSKIRYLKEAKKVYDNVCVATLNKRFNFK